MMKVRNVMLYGANGFTAGLVLEKLFPSMPKVILAGRNPKIKELGHKYQLEARIFSLDKKEVVQKNLRDIDLIVNCAGPFSFTAHILARAAIDCRCDYFDISGELNVFSDLLMLDEKAKKNKVTLVPGMGFDIVPSDCLAALLAKKIRAPSKLTLAIWPKNTRASHGTLRSALLKLQDGSKNIQKNLKPIKFRVNEKSIHCIPAPLADLIAAPLSSGITNVKTYLALPKKINLLAKSFHILRPLFRTKVMQKIMGSIIEAMPSGPTKEQQKNGSALIYGEVKNNKEEIIRAIMITPEPYAYTSDLIITSIKKWSSTELVPGFKTPSQAFGINFAKDTRPDMVAIKYLETV